MFIRFVTTRARRPSDWRASKRAGPQLPTIDVIRRPPSWHDGADVSQ